MSGARLADNDAMVAATTGAAAATEGWDAADVAGGALAGEMQFAEFEASQALADAELAQIESVDREPGEDGGLLISVMAMENRDMSKPAANERFVSVTKPSTGTVLAAVVRQVKRIALDTKMQIAALVINAHGAPGIFVLHTGGFAQAGKNGKPIFNDDVDQQETIDATKVAPLGQLAPYFKRDGTLTITGCGAGASLVGFQLGAALAKTLPDIKIYLTANTYNQVKFKGDRPGAESFGKTPSGPAVSYKTYQYATEQSRLTVEHVWRNDVNESVWSTSGYGSLLEAFFNVGYDRDMNPIGSGELLETSTGTIEAVNLLSTLSTAQQALELMDVLRVNDLRLVLQVLDNEWLAHSTVRRAFGAFYPELTYIARVLSRATHHTLRLRLRATLQRLAELAESYLISQQATLSNKIDAYYGSR